jgi:aminoglycoside phosphotransferase
MLALLLEKLAVRKLHEIDLQICPSAVSASPVWKAERKKMKIDPD